MNENSMTQLIDDYLDGELDDAGGERLRAWLEADPANVRAFVRQVFLHQQLREGLLAQNVGHSLGATASIVIEPPLLRRRYRRKRLAAVLLVVFIGVWGWLRGGNPLDNELAAVKGDSISKPVAYLASVNGCDWGTGKYRSQTIGSAILPAEEVALHEGIAEFRLASGASVSIEGPAALSLTSPTSLKLQYGKLTVHVPWTVTNFTVLSEVCSVTACDAEFGVALSQEGEASVIDLHAFSGTVLAVPGLSENAGGLDGAVKDESKLAPGSAFALAAVAEGRSLSVSTNGDRCKVSGWDSADESLFATKLPMAWPLPISRAYVRAVTESAPLGYWRFESQENSFIKNERAEGGDLRVIGSLRLTGNDSNNVADFNRLGSDCYLLSTQTLDSLSNADEYSVELWFKPSHVHWGGIASFITSPSTAEEGHAFYLELQGTPSDDQSPLHPAIFVKPHPGTIRFLHRNPPHDTAREHGASCFSNERYGIRRWQHVVAVKRSGEINLYLNGKLTSRQDDDSKVGAEPLYLLVGRRSSPERTSWYAYSRSALSLVGQLDEIAVYGRALSDDEIRGHFEAVRWDANSTSGGPRGGEDDREQVDVTSI